MWSRPVANRVRRPWPIPSYNSVNFFGPCPASVRIEPPNARQVNSYPGVAGVEVIELGQRTSATEFTGLWVADTPDDLATFLMQMITIKRAGGFSTLVDTKGITSSDAILETFELTGETRWSPSEQGWAVPYRMRFLHIGFIPPAS